MRERERGRKRYSVADIADDFAYIATAAIVDDSISDIDSDAISATVAPNVVDASLVDDPNVVSASGAAPQKAHHKRNRPRSPYHFRSRFPQMLCSFSNSSTFLLYLAII